MNIIEKIQPLYKHLIVVLLFLATTYFAFTPAYSGKVLEQHDIEMWLGSAKECNDYRLNHDGEETMWTNSMFGGMPTYLVSANYPSNLTQHVTHYLTLLTPNPANKFIVSLICFYVCLLCFKVKWQWAAFGSIAYSYSTFNMISIAAGHNSKIMALALLPLLVGGLKLIFDRKYLLGAAVLALGTSLELGAGHIQITYYGIFILLFFGISQGISLLLEKDFKTLGLVIVVSLGAGLLGVLPHASRLMNIQEYGKYSIRGETELTVQAGDVSDGLSKDYVFQYSQGIKENLSLIVPNLFSGGEAGPWADGSSYAFYLGISTFLLFVLGFVVLKPKEYIWLVLLAALGILTALGKNFPSFNYWLYENFPGYNKFRTVNMALALTQFAVVLMAALSMNKIFSEDFVIDKKIKIVFASFLGFFGIIIIYSSMADGTSLYDSQYPAEYLGQIIAERKSSMRSAILQPLFFLGLFVTLFVFYQKSKHEKKQIIFGVLASLLIFTDLAIVNSKNFKDEAFVEDTGERIYPSKANRYLLKQEGNFRVLDVSKDPFTDTHASHFHQSLGGYHPAKLRRFQDIIDKHISQNNMKVMMMLNAKYVIQAGDKKPLELPTLGNAWFVQKVESVKNPDEEIAYLANQNFDPATIAVVDETKFKTEAKEYQNTGKITLDKYEANKLEYTAETDKNGLAVFSEIYYPIGWKATIDGKETSLSRVNYILRAMEIPAGKHKIVFEFRPDSYYSGEKIAFAGSILVFLLFAVSLFFTYKKELA